MKRHGLVGVRLHGEANEKTPEEEAALMDPWLKEFHKYLDENNIGPERTYNADQTGLFYQKLPNMLYGT